jgi:ribosome-associated protein
MLKALMNAALDKVRGDYHLTIRAEGEAENGWLLIDFGDIILHIFSTDQREYYQLEKLWSIGKVLLHVQ